MTGGVLSIAEAIARFGPANRQGQRVVFVYGSFDLLHPGHLYTIEQARALGDLLIIGLYNDASVLRLNGPGNPITPELERAEILAALDCVGAVVIFDAPMLPSLIAGILPDVLVNPASRKYDALPGWAEVQAAGGRIVSIPVLPGYSTGDILRKIRATPSAPAKP